MIETLEQYSPNFEENLSDRVSPVFIETRSGRVKILETNDFPTTDPWSEFFRETLKNLTEEGFFEGEEVVEFGIGDGRNELVIGNVGKIIGIDIDSWRLEVASENLKRCEITKNIPTDLYHQHATALLLSYDRRGTSPRLANRQSSRPSFGRSSPCRSLWSASAGAAR